MSCLKCNELQNHDFHREKVSTSNVIRDLNHLASPSFSKEQTIEMNSKVHFLYVISLNAHESTKPLFSTLKFLLSNSLSTSSEHFTSNHNVSDTARLLRDTVRSRMSQINSFSIGVLPQESAPRQ